MKSVIFLALSTLFLMEVLILPAKVLAIYNGNIVNTIADYPFMCGIYRNLPDGSIKSFCGCSIVSPNFALTAATCFDDKDPGSEFTFFAGSVYVNEGLTRQVNKNTDVIIHRNYNVKGTYLLTHYNLAIIKLNPPLIFEDNVQSIRLAGPNDCVAIDGYNIIYPLNKLRYTITGWGINSTVGVSNRLSTNLLWGKALPETRNMCEDLFRLFGYDHEHNICTNKDSGPCYGDTGGPLSYRDTSGRLEYSKTKGFVLCGVIARGENSCNKKHSIYMRVSYYMQWICENTNSEPEGCKEFAARKNSFVFHKPL